MSNLIRTEINLTTGEPQNSPGVQVFIKLVTGDTNTTSFKSQILEITNQESLEFNGLVSIPCMSQESATTLKNIMSGFWTVGKYRINDSLNGPDSITLKFSVFNSSVIILVGIGQAYRYKAEEALEFVQSIAGESFGHDQHVHFEIDVGNHLHALMTSTNILVDLFNAFNMTASIEAHPSLLQQLSNYSENLQCGEQFKKYSRLMTIYKGLNISLRLGSFNELPEDFKSFLNELTVQYNPSLLHTSLPKNLKPIIQAFAQHATGELHVYAGAGRLITELKVKAPGASEFFLS